MKDKIKAVGGVLMMLLMVLNVICAIAGLAGVDNQEMSIGLAQANSMLAVIFAYFAWQK